MIRVDVTRSQFYSENSDSENQEYFYLTAHKFLHNIDNFYYSVFLKEDSNENTNLDSLIEGLSELKLKVKNSKDKEPINFLGTGLNLSMKRYVFYEYCLSDHERFDIFISDYLPNNKTARIVVQLRANALWLEGYSDLLLSSYHALEGLLHMFGLDIERTLENRNDMCYHTNMIQNPSKALSDPKLEKNLYTTLSNYQKIGKIKKKGKNRLTVEYLALGQRISNNVFFRCYNKTREVIEEGYKSFFFEIWRNNKLISYYDQFCLEFAYKKKNYDALHEARLRFYLKYGKDRRVQQEILLLFSDLESRMEDIKYLADQLMPNVTIIMNIEYETKRKFYYYADAQLDQLPLERDCPDQLKRPFKILDNRKLFLDYLTSTTVAFKEDDDIYIDWWKRLRSCKIDGLKVNQEYTRKYALGLEIEKIQKRIVNSIATASVYDKKKDTGFVEDFSMFLSNINDNDMKNVGMIDLDTGEIMTHISTDLIEDYRIYKEKKYRAIKNRISHDSPKSVEKNPQ